MFVFTFMLIWGIEPYDVPPSVLPTRFVVAGRWVLEFDRLSVAAFPECIIIVWAALLKISCVDEFSLIFLLTLFGSCLMPFGG